MEKLLSCGVMFGVLPYLYDFYLFQVYICLIKELFYWFYSQIDLWVSSWKIISLRGIFWLINLISLSHIYQPKILPLIWSREGPLFFSSFVNGIQFQSQLTVTRYPTSTCQINIKRGCSNWGANGLSFFLF